MDHKLRYYILCISIALLFTSPTVAQNRQQQIKRTDQTLTLTPANLEKEAYKMWYYWYKAQKQGNQYPQPTFELPKDLDPKEASRVRAVLQKAQQQAKQDVVQAQMLPKVDVATAYKAWSEWYTKKAQGIQIAPPTLILRNINEQQAKHLNTIWEKGRLQAEKDFNQKQLEAKTANTPAPVLASATPNGTPNTRLYGGQEYDPDLGFYYLRSRFLDTAKGRFLTQDTFEGMNDDPLSLHKYAYASNDPVNNQDPSGLVSISTIANTSIFNQITLSSAKLQTSSFLGQGGSTVGGTPIRTLRGQLCDFQLGFLFGGFGAVAAANGFEPDGTYRPHLDPNAEKYMHIYGNKESTAITSVFIPGNGVLVNKLSASYSTYLFHYDNFQGRKSVELTASHIQGFRLENQIQALKRKSSRNTNLKIPIENASAVRNAAGFVFIGLIGGLGGEATPKGNYIHSHFVIGNKVVASGDRFVGDLSFPQVFCGNTPNRLPIDKVLTQSK